MVNITIFELNVEDGSFSATLPFGSPEEDSETEGDEEGTGIADDEDSGGSKGLVLLGVLVFLIIATAAVKYLTGDDEEAEDEPPAATA